jgi:hypothetical protein
MYLYFNMSLYMYRLRSNTGAKFIQPKNQESHIDFFHLLKLLKSHRTESVFDEGPLTVIASISEDVKINIYAKNNRFAHRMFPGEPLPRGDQQNNTDDTIVLNVKLGHVLLMSGIYINYISYII